MKPRVNVTELTLAQLSRLRVTVYTLPLLFTRVNITRQWKSTFKLHSVKFYVGMSWTVYARAQPELSIIISLAPYRSNVYIL